MEGSCRVSIARQRISWRMDEDSKKTGGWEPLITGLWIIRIFRMASWFHGLSVVHDMSNHWGAVGEQTSEASWPGRDKGSKLTSGSSSLTLRTASSTLPSWTASLISIRS